MELKCSFLFFFLFPLITLSSGLLIENEFHLPSRSRADRGVISSLCNARFTQVRFPGIDNVYEARCLAEIPSNDRANRRENKSPDERRDLFERSRVNNRPAERLYRRAS